MVQRGAGQERRQRQPLQDERKRRLPQPVRLAEIALHGAYEEATVLDQQRTIEPELTTELLADRRRRVDRQEHGHRIAREPLHEEDDREHAPQHDEHQPQPPHKVDDYVRAGWAKRNRKLTIERGSDRKPSIMRYSFGACDLPPLTDATEGEREAERVREEVHGSGAGVERNRSHPAGVRPTAGDEALDDSLVHGRLRARVGTLHADGDVLEAAATQVRAEGFEGFDNLESRHQPHIDVRNRAVCHRRRRLLTFSQAARVHRVDVERAAPAEAAEQLLGVLDAEALRPELAQGSATVPSVSSRR